MVMTTRVSKYTTKGKASPGRERSGGRQTEDIGQNIQSDHRGGETERNWELAGLCALHCS